MTRLTFWAYDGMMCGNLATAILASGADRQTIIRNLDQFGHLRDLGICPIRRKHR